MRFILLQAFRDVMSLISMCYILCLFILKRYNKIQLGMFSHQTCVLAKMFWSVWISACKPVNLFLTAPHVPSCFILLFFFLSHSISLQLTIPSFFVLSGCGGGKGWVS